MADDARLAHEPDTRLTYVANDLIAAFDDHPLNHPGDKCIVFLYSGDNREGGVGMQGYDDQYQAMAELLSHLQAIFKASGKQLDIAFLGDDGVDRIGGG